MRPPASGSEASSCCTLIVEDNVDGHRLYYVRLIAERALELGHDVAIAVPPGCEESEDFQTHLSGVVRNVRTLNVVVADRASIEELVGHTKACLVVVPDGDSLVFELGRSGRWASPASLSALVMRETAQPSPLPGLQSLKSVTRRLLVARAGRLSGVSVHVLKSATWRGRSNIAVVRDPVTLSCSRDSARLRKSAWGLGEGRYWFGILGAISPRKNVGLFVESLEAASVNCGLLLAGRISEELLHHVEEWRSRLASVGVPLIVRDQLLKDEDLDSAVALLDCVVLAHSNEGPSGLMGKAASAGTRVLAAGARTLKADSQALPHVVSWSPLDRGSLSLAIHQTVQMDRPDPVVFPPPERFADHLLLTESL